MRKEGKGGTLSTCIWRIVGMAELLSRGAEFLADGKRALAAAEESGRK
jgi:hypothetical protein